MTVYICKNGKHLLRRTPSMVGNPPHTKCGWCGKRVELVLAPEEYQIDRRTREPGKYGRSSESYRNKVRRRGREPDDVRLTI